MRLAVLFAGLLAVAVSACGPIHGSRASARAIPCLGDGAGAMAWVPGGETWIGSDAFQPEEQPVRKVRVDGFWIDRHEVTNAQFAEFVRRTGYVTHAERDGRGGVVFAPPARPASSPWWRIDPQASWRRPAGAKGPAADPSLPVVQVTHADALAYARWRGGDLPTEAEWERAARGGLVGKDYVWGDDPRPGGKPAANHWQGVFPVKDTAEDGFPGLAPVGCFRANGYGVYDMAGNAWEWVQDPWPRELGGAPEGAHIIKGGSYLCADDYCLRYRPAARQPGEPALGASHTGFRIVRRGAPPRSAL